MNRGIFTDNSTYIPSNTYGYKKTHSEQFISNECRVCHEYIYHDKAKMKNLQWSRIVHVPCARKERFTKKRRAKFALLREQKELIKAQQIMKPMEVIIQNA